MMPVEGIGSLLQRLEDQLLGRTYKVQPGANTQGTLNLAGGEDTFTQSTHSNSAQAIAQDAGIFQVSQGALTAVTANILLAEATPNANLPDASAKESSGTAANAGNAHPAPPANTIPPVNAGQLFPPPPAGQSTAAKATPASNVQVQIQALNAALPALGLSKVEIQEIDRLATLIQNFNPGAYTNLVNQFEALGKQATQPNAASAAADAGTAGSQNAPASTKASGSGSQS
jgi:hypothetical protein